MPKKREPSPVIAYPREAVLNKYQLAAGLGVGVQTALRANLPFTMVGSRERFVWGQVLDVLAERALPSAPDADRLAAARSIEHLQMAQLAQLARRAS